MSIVMFKQGKSLFKQGRLLAWIAGLAVVGHALSIHTVSLPYTTDELQYFAWSKHLDWGYFSKPPGIAFALWLWSAFDPFANSLRWFAQLCYGLSLLVGFQLFRDDGLPVHKALIGSLVLGSMPLIGFAQWFFTTDALLLICWLSALALCWRAFTAKSARQAACWWCLLGVAVAVGVLCKHFMLFFWLGIATYLILIRSRAREHLSGLCLCFIVFSLVLMPHLIWLFDHPGTTIKHLIELQEGRGQPSQQDSSIFSLLSISKRFLQGVEFAAAQWLGLGFAVIMVIRVRARVSELQVLLLAHSVPILFVFIIQAAVGRANANWALPATFTLGIALLTHFLHQTAIDARDQPGKGSSLGLIFWVLSNLAISLFISFGAQALKFIRPESLIWIDRIDPFHRQRGWDEFDRALAALNKPATIPWGVSDRDAAARILHRYGEGQLVYRLLPGSKPNHFAIRYPYQSLGEGQLHKAQGACAWFLAREGDAAQAKGIEPIARVERVRLSGRSETWIVWPESCHGQGE